MRYYPWGGCYKALCRQDAWSRKGILDLKDARFPDGQERAIAMAAPMLADLLANGIVLVPAPSSTAGKISGITMLAQHIASAKPTIIDGTNCLVRTETIPKAATGGPRSLDLHRRTIAAAHPEIFRDRLVVLLDDVLTSGSTIQVCREKLLAAGATAVCCLALGRTYSSNPSIIPPVEALLRTFLQERFPILRSNYELAQPHAPAASSGMRMGHFT